MKKDPKGRMMRRRKRAPILMNTQHHSSPVFFLLHQASEYNHHERGYPLSLLLQHPCVRLAFLFPSFFTALQKSSIRRQFLGHTHLSLSLSFLFLSLSLFPAYCQELQIMPQRAARHSLTWYYYSYASSRSRLLHAAAAAAAA